MNPSSGSSGEDVPVSHGLGHLPGLLTVRLGSLQVLDRVIAHAWPLVRGVAGLYRRTLTRTTCVVAVVGSFGKSTTARAVVVALGQRPHRYLVFNSQTWVPLALLRVRPGQRHAVIEVAITRSGQMVVHAHTVRLAC